MSYRREEGPPLPRGVSYEWFKDSKDGWLVVRQNGGLIFHASTTPESWSPDDVVALLEQRGD